MFLALVLVAITVGLAYRGYSFYKLSLEDRVEHPDFRRLRPSGVIGNGYGWVAAMLVVLNLSYLIRRRFGGAKLGSMRGWLDIHVFTGLLAASLVTFHSAFQLRTPIATVSAASLGLVVLTGLIGRFLYALAPTSGRERLQAALDAFGGQRDALATAIAELPGPSVAANASLLRSLLAIRKWRRASRARRDALRLLLPPTRQQSREVAARCRRAPRCRLGRGSSVGNRRTAAVVARAPSLLRAAHARRRVPSRRRGLVLRLPLDLHVRILVVVAFALAVSRPVSAQLLSPGPLSQAHANIDGDNDCGKCHESGKQVVARLCLDCHKDLKAGARREPRPARQAIQGQTVRGLPRRARRQDREARALAGVAQPTSSITR